MATTDLVDLDHRPTITETAGRTILEILTHHRTIEEARDTGFHIRLTIIILVDTTIDAETIVVILGIATKVMPTMNMAVGGMQDSAEAPPVAVVVVAAVVLEAQKTADGAVGVTGMIVDPGVVGKALGVLVDRSGIVYSPSSLKKTCATLLSAR